MDQSSIDSPRDFIDVYLQEMEHINRKMNSGEIENKPNLFHGK